MNLKYTIYRTKLSIILILFLFQLFASVTPLDSSRDTLTEQTVSPFIPSSSETENTATNDFSQPLLKLQSFQTPSILFIIDDEFSPDPSLDEPFYNFMSNNLSFNVIYHTANDSYNYTNFDAIVISKSVEQEDTVETLGNATIPILTMEAGHFDEFSLGDASGVTTNYFEWTLTSTPHYILDEVIVGVVAIYDSNAITNFLKGFKVDDYPIGCDVKQLAYHTSPSGPQYASLVALEKGGLRFDLNKSAERRVFWGASSTDNFVLQTWSLWNKSLHWILYDDYSGNAEINVHVQDLLFEDILNANVKLTDSNNLSISWSENTSLTGLVSFTNIPWGEYDIKVSFRYTENSSLSSLQIVPPKTYMRTYSFDYSVIIDETIDESPPDITGVLFDYSKLTFNATVTDGSPIKYVYLNLTAHNLSTGFPEIIPEINSTNFTMIEGLGSNYFNATSLESLNGIFDNITLTYNIIAEDIIGNYFATNIQTFNLTDPVAPYIWSYGSYDLGNGTVAFSANITDENGVQAPVKLEINGQLFDMSQEESNLWVFSTDYYFGSFLNYTIFYTTDIIGNENGSSVYPEQFPYKNITTTDTTPPRISALSNPFADHDEGYVYFEVDIDETTIFQTGINKSMIFIILMINDEENFTTNMNFLEGITYFYEYTFDFGDNVTYWINAYDNVNNSIFSKQQLDQSSGNPYRIDDNAIPSVSFSAEEYGNGTINFFAQVIDWPNNDTSAQIFFTNDYFAIDWVNESMIKLNSTTFQFYLPCFPYQIHAIWYYVNALDSEDNLYDTQIESAQSLQLTDLIAPVIDLTYVNSSTIDGEIILIAQATDPYGSIYILNNSISINISSLQGDVSTPMTFEEGTTYIFSTSYLDQTELNITAWVSDTNGNTGFKSILIIVADKAPPTILQYGIESFTNGTLTIYAEVVEGIYGSGLLDDNSSVTLIYIYKTQFTEVMTWNGTGNFYSYPIPGLDPNDVVSYRFEITDKSNNVNLTEWEQYFIADTVIPEIIDFNTIEIQKDHISTEITFWTIARDDFGDIHEVILNYSIQTQEGWLNYSVTMSQAGMNYYEKQITVLPNSNIQYKIIVIDTFHNIATTNYTTILTADFSQSQFGVDGYSFDINNPGECSVWIVVDDKFEEHLHNVTITVIDLNTSTMILNNIKMNSEGLNYSISIEVEYLHQFSYSFVLSDLGTLNGFYDAKIRNSTTFHMLDYWSPIIHEVGVDKINEETYLFWANITDYGEDLHSLDVILNFELEAISGAGSEIAIYEQIQMEFNETHFIRSITFDTSGTLVWDITASDGFSSSDSYPGISTPIVLDQGSSGIDIEWIFAAVIVTSIAFLLIMSSIIKLRRRQSMKLDRKQSFVEKLNIFSNIYTIMVSSSAGVPVWTKTNVLYKSDDSMNGNLSGLSVGIDSFLDSFQSDFLTHVQDSRSQSTSQLDGNISVRVIEQNEVQIMILGSYSYRMFVFLKDIPSLFIRETFLTIIKTMENSLPLPDLGIVDEDLQGPLVERVFRKYLPIGLLEPFKIDLDQLSDFDARFKSHKIVTGMTKNGINVLKILSISHLVHASAIKQNKQALLKIFKKSRLSDPQLYSGTLLYTDAMNLVSKLSIFTPEELYEAFWLGIDSKILIPVSNI